MIVLRVALAKVQQMERGPFCASGTIAERQRLTTSSVEQTSHTGKRGKKDEGRGSVARQHHRRRHGLAMDLVHN